MKFTLTYTGDLKSNAKPKHKHELRKAFHVQLRNLWSQEPISDHRKWFDGSDAKTSINLKRPLLDFHFVPLISPDLHLVCKLDIYMLRPEPPGAIVTQAGDIDNRLKTLFDALRIPQNEDEIPKHEKPGLEEDPFFCLLEDDILISGVSVQTDRLLLPTTSDSEVHLDIRVTTQLTRVLTGNKIVGGFALA